MPESAKPFLDQQAMMNTDRTQSAGTSTICGPLFVMCLINLVGLFVVVIPPGLLRIWLGNNKNAPD